MVKHVHWLEQWSSATKLVASTSSQLLRCYMSVNVFAEVLYAIRLEALCACKMCLLAEVFYASVCIRWVLYAKKLPKLGG